MRESSVSERVEQSTKSSAVCVIKCKENDTVAGSDRESGTKELKAHVLSKAKRHENFSHGVEQ